MANVRLILVTMETPRWNEGNNSADYNHNGTTDPICIELFQPFLLNINTI